MNILLIVVDCLRADHISYYGYSKPTPNIDALASKSDVYERTHSAGALTIQSIPYILSEYLYEVLKKNGYAAPTVIHPSPVVSRYLKSSGIPYLNIDTYEHPRRYPGSRTVHRIVRRIKANIDAVYGTNFAHDTRAPHINEVAKSVITALSSPFFLCLWYMDVHTPLLPPGRTGLSDIMLCRKHLKTINGYAHLSDKERKRVIDLYDGEIAFFDSHLNTILEYVPEDTAIIFTADHGDEFGEDGQYGHHDKDIDVLRWVPLFVHIPGKQTERHRFFDFMNFDKMIESLIK